MMRINCIMKKNKKGEKDVKHEYKFDGPVNEKVFSS